MIAAAILREFKFMSNMLSPDDRAYLLDWVAAVFLHEITEDGIAVLRSDDGAALLESVASVPGLDADVAALRAAIQATCQAAGSNKDAALALAGRFSTLFLGAAGPKAAHPYASVYRDGRTHGAATERVAAFLAAHDLAVDSASSEPPDHLGLMLGTLAELSRREAVASEPDAQALFEAQKAFVTAELLPWLPQFQGRVEHDDPAGYFAAMTSLACHALEAFYGR